jgi:hypothetical protein
MPRPLPAVAGTTKRLQIVEIQRSTLGLRVDVIDSKVVAGSTVNASKMIAFEHIETHAAANGSFLKTTGARQALASGRISEQRVGTGRNVRKSPALNQGRHGFCDLVPSAAAKLSMLICIDHACAVPVIRELDQNELGQR